MATEYCFTVNGMRRTTTEKKSLLRYLRDDLHLFSVKDGCSEGACGTCTIIVDGVAVKACVLTTDKSVGRNIVTVEGLTEREQDAFVYAFGSKGSVQCGFCIPGMVMAGKALIDQNPDPTEEEIKYAEDHNIPLKITYETNYSKDKNLWHLSHEGLDLEYPDFAAIPITTGIKTAAVPVLESTPLINPTIIMIAMISCLSVLAKCVTTPPILFAIPVSNNAPPTINIATNKMTLLSINPANAVFQSNTPVTTRPTQMIMDVTPSGIFSHTNITMANNKNNNVIVAGLISFLLPSSF